MVDKKKLTERDICTKYITPALEAAGWDTQTQFLEEYALTDGRINVRGQSIKRDAPKRADYVLFYKPNIPIAVIEAKVDTLMALCDQLQANIAAARTESEKLTASTIHHLLAG